MEQRNKTYHEITQLISRADSPDEQHKMFAHLIRLGLILYPELAATVKEGVKLVKTGTEKALQELSAAEQGRYCKKVAKEVEKLVLNRAQGDASLEKEILSEMCASPKIRNTVLNDNLACEVSAAFVKTPTRGVEENAAITKCVESANLLIRNISQALRDNSEPTAEFLALKQLSQLALTLHPHIVLTSAFAARLSAAFALVKHPAALTIAVLLAGNDEAEEPVPLKWGKMPGTPNA